MGDINISMDNPGNPLREFIGTLKEYKTPTFTPPVTTEDPHPKTRVRVEFDFVDVEVIRTEEPYPYPVTTISVGYADPHASGSTTNRWAHLSKSVRKITLGACPPAEVLDFLVGKRQTWEQVELTIRTPDDDGNWADRPTLCWTLKSLEGVEQDSGGDIMDHLVGLMDGKNETDIYAAIFADAKIKLHPEIIQQATDRELMGGLVASNRLTRDDEGIYHKVTG